MIGSSRIFLNTFIHLLLCIIEAQTTDQTIYVHFWINSRILLMRNAQEKNILLFWSFTYFEKYIIRISGAVLISIFCGFRFCAW